MTTRRPLPRDVPAALRPPEFHSESLVPSLWFCTTSTASSAWRFAGLLHPAADHEVRCVCARSVPNTAGEGGVGSRGEFLAARLGPLEGCSPSTAVPRHRGRCPLAVGVPACDPHSFHPVARMTLVQKQDGCVGFKALLRRRVRGPAASFPT